MASMAFHMSWSKSSSPSCDTMKLVLGERRAIRTSRGKELFQSCLHKEMLLNITIAAILLDVYRQPSYSISPRI